MSEDSSKSLAGSKLSYSAINTYKQCGRKYKLHYVDRIRPVKRSSALCFGTAIDKAVEAKLNNKDINAKDIFDTWWQKQTINKEVIELCGSILLDYYISDFDFDLLIDDDIKFLKAKAEELIPKIYKEYGDWLLAYNECLKHKKQRAFRTWPENENKFYNLCNWLSLRRKGHLMVEALEREVLPKIKQVIYTQHKTQLKNTEGDVLDGFADAVVEWEDGRTIILDFKTSSVKYEANAVSVSEQLTIYSLSTGIKLAGYIVFMKKIDKDLDKMCGDCGTAFKTTRQRKCEVCNKESGVYKVKKLRALVDIIIDTIPTKTEDVVLDTIHETNQSIKDEVFDPNFHSCKSFLGPCPYFDLCHKNSMKGLIKLG